MLPTIFRRLFLSGGFFVLRLSGSRPTGSTPSATAEGVCRGAGHILFRDAGKRRILPDLSRARLPPRKFLQPSGPRPDPVFLAVKCHGAVLPANVENRSIPCPFAARLHDSFSDNAVTSVTLLPFLSLPPYLPSPSNGAAGTPDRRVFIFTGRRQKVAGYPDPCWPAPEYTRRPK